LDEEFVTEVDVEKAAKRKLVSAALIMISVQSKVNRVSQLKQALSDWRSFLLSSQIAEGAFNKILELNHRHCKARFSTAVRLLEKIARRQHGAYFLDAL